MKDNGRCVHIHYCWLGSVSFVTTEEGAGCSVKGVLLFCCFAVCLWEY